MKADEDTSGRPKVSASVRLFSSQGDQDLADELRRLGVAEATVTAQRQRQTTAKLRLTAESRRSVAQVVASFPALTLYVQLAEHQDQDETAVLTGSISALGACASAISQLAAPIKDLGDEILRQLPQLFCPQHHRLAYPGGTLDLSAKTAIMGILNVTPDSFYDGGRYVDPQAALDRALQMIAEGADIVDIGGQSSRPGSEPVPEAEEARRVLPVVRAIAQAGHAIISVDTYRADIARAALDAGAHVINDISALRFDPNLLNVVAERQAALILMHMQGSPRDMQLNPTYDAVIDEVYAFLADRLQAARAGGLDADRVLIDPGIGFGKGTQHNLEILRKLHHFLTLARPIVIGTSRKAFIGRILGTGVDERLEGTAATVALAIAQGAAVVRVHDVRAMTYVARMMDAMLRPHFTPHQQDHNARDVGHPTAAARSEEREQ